jgi:hypothetical protein
LITRTILPVVGFTSPAPGIDSEFGLSDTVQSFFFSPKAVLNGVTWGVGTVFLWPTATDRDLGSDKWGAGPTFVILRQQSGWTYGMLTNHVWSYADASGGSRKPEVDATFIQPFLSYTWPDSTTLTLNTESTYDWRPKNGTCRSISSSVTSTISANSRCSWQWGGAFTLIVPARALTGACAAW